MITVERRIDWAAQRLSELWGAVDAYMARDPVDVQVEDTGPGSYVFRGHIRERPPEELSLLAGDFIHNLRSSLDNLIWEVAGATAPQPNSLAFLVAKKPEAFKEAVKRKRLAANVDPAIVFAMVTCQPFVSPEDGGLMRGDLLGLLDDFWNEDKHRAPASILGLYSVASGTVWTGDHPPPAIQASGDQFIDGAVVAKLSGWQGPRPYVEQANFITFEPRFMTPRAPKQAVFRYAFLAMLNTVRDAVLPRFAAFR